VYATRYKFNGKELDPQTGYYYYGARYYDPVVSRWLSIDPLAEKYPGLSPYNYTANNPVMLVDPDGKWVKDSKGNLVAEKGDNAWTLAKYLNTSPYIAIKMLGEQGYKINSKGILQLKVGDVFKVEYSSPKPKMRPNLGFIGNRIRDKAGSEFGKNLFENYWLGRGDVKLSSQRFAAILLYIKENNPKRYRKKTINIRTSDGRCLSGYSQMVSFYASKEYSRAFGTATIIMNKRNEIIGFYDLYNFDSKPWGARSFKNEVITRSVKFFSSFSNAKPFKIRYGFSF